MFDPLTVVKIVGAWSKHLQIFGNGGKRSDKFWIIFGKCSDILRKIMVKNVVFSMFLKYYFVLKNFSSTEKKNYFIYLI